MHGFRTTLAVLAAALTIACGRERAPAPAASADSAAPAAAPALPDKLEGFKNPESARYDAELDVWYVSNVNGDALARDGNGYISRLKGNETVDSMQFIAGGRNGVTLNAPKGLAIVGDTLWVADIDAVRAFNRKTGEPVASIDLKGKAKFLNDAAAGPDGVYFTDSGFGPDGKGGMAHTGPDQIFKVSGRKAAVALKSGALAAPNGIAWDTAGNRFIVGPFAGKTLQAWTPGQTKLTSLGETPGQVDGIEVLGPDRVLLTSWTDSTLNTLQNGKLTPFGGKMPSPADIGVDTKRGRVAIPLLLENRVEFRALPAATP